MVDVSKPERPAQPAMPSDVASELPADIRERAIKRLKKRRDLTGHALVYVLVNSFIVVIWAVTSHGFFWPVFPIAGWGIGLVMNAWDVWCGGEFTDDDVAREILRMGHDGRR